MVNKVIFHVISESLAQSAKADDLRPEERLICDQIAHYRTLKKRIYLQCESQQQAERLDDALWQYPLDQFLPHNLKGEGMSSGSPILIGWDDVVTGLRYDVLFNLDTTVPSFYQRFQQIVDVVPFDTERKAAARDRYRWYKQHGWLIETLTVTS